MTHNHKSKGLTSPTYHSWSSMKQRCLNKNRTNFKFYGDKGILICDRWLNSFENFLEDMGTRPDGMTLDRIDTTKGYCKENCRWATHKQQANNRISNKPISYLGITLTTEEWAKKIGISKDCLKLRLHRKWPLEKALKG